MKHNRLTTSHKTASVASIDLELLASRPIRPMSRKSFSRTRPSLISHFFFIRVVRCSYNSKFNFEAAVAKILWTFSMICESEKKKCKLLINKSFAKIHRKDINYNLIRRGKDLDDKSKSSHCNYIIKLKVVNHTYLGTSIF